MAHPEEEIYVTLVVVKRPVGGGGADFDPGRWADLILNGLVSAGAEHQAAVLTRRIGRGGCMHGTQPRFPAGSQPGHVGSGASRAGRPQQRPWIYMACAILCFLLAAYFTQFLLQ